MENSEKWSTASIVISSKSLDAEKITEFLKIKPTKTYKKGELLSKRNPKSRKREDHLWCLKSNIAKSEPLDEHISELLLMIKGREDTFRSFPTDCKCEIFCGFSSGNGQGGFTLAHEIIEKLNEFPLDIVLDLYPPENS